MCAYKMFYSHLNVFSSAVHNASVYQGRVFVAYRGRERRYHKSVSYSPAIKKRNFLKIQSFRIPLYQPHGNWTLEMLATIYWFIHFCIPLFVPMNSWGCQWLSFSLLYSPNNHAGWEYLVQAHPVNFMAQWKLEPNLPVPYLRAYLHYWLPPQYAAASPPLLFTQRGRHNGPGMASEGTGRQGAGWLRATGQEAV